MIKYNIDKELKALHFFFVSKDIYAATALMKCELPSNAINLLGGRSAHIKLADFVNLSKENYFNNKSVIVFLKVGSNLEEQTLKQIEKTKDFALAMFCDINDNYEYFVEEYTDSLDYEKDRVLRFCNLMDGMLYESSDLKKVMTSYSSNIPLLKTRHAHTNCSKQLNPFSMIEGENGNQLFKQDNHIQQDGIFNFGYTGRPKHCTDFLRLTRAIYRTGAQCRFIHSHPNIETNMSLTYDLDMGFSLYDHDDWTRKLKPANKIMNYISLGIPCLFSPFTSYIDLFLENNIDYKEYIIPDREKCLDSTKHYNNVSIESSDSLRDVILNLIHSNDFHEKRRALWEMSKRYNPMNISFLYDEMILSIKEKM
tara:strand:+ start:82 stop:1182 length:1101 start_codon:yes stop_codon:yes gene_type:complete